MTHYKLTTIENKEKSYVYSQSHKNNKKNRLNHSLTDLGRISLPKEIRVTSKETNFVYSSFIICLHISTKEHLSRLIIRKKKKKK